MTKMYGTAPTRFGHQPVKEVVRRRGMTATQLAEMIGVRPKHLRNVLRGHQRPTERMGEMLPLVLGVPLRRLFTKEVLARPLLKDKR